MSATCEVSNRKHPLVSYYKIPNIMFSLSEKQYQIDFQKYKYVITCIFSPFGAKL